MNQVPQVRFHSHGSLAHHGSPPCIPDALIFVSHIQIAHNHSLHLRATETFSEHAFNAFLCSL